MSLSPPTIVQFVEELAEEPKWYDLGVFLEVPKIELDKIELDHSKDGTRRCLTEVYSYLNNMEMLPSWEDISLFLKKINNAHLSNSIRKKYFQENPVKPLPMLSQEVVPVEKKIVRQFEQVEEAYNDMEKAIRQALIQNSISIKDIRFTATQWCGDDELREDDVDNILIKLRNYSCFLNIKVFEALVKDFLREHKEVNDKLEEYKKQLDEFKKLTELETLMANIYDRQYRPTDTQTCVGVKLKEIWRKVTIQKFERLANQIFIELYSEASNIQVREGCIYLSWFINKKHTKRLTAIIQSSEKVLELVGVKSINIGETLIYSNPIEGCATMESALIQAVQQNNSEAVEILLTADADVNTILCGGTTPLMVASREGYTEVVRVLLKENIMINATSGSGETAIYKASKQGHSTIVHILLEAGANPRIPSNKGQTPLTAAIEKGHTEILEMLRSTINVSTNIHQTGKCTFTNSLILNMNALILFQVLALIALFIHQIKQEYLWLEISLSLLYFT